LISIGALFLFSCRGPAGNKIKKETINNDSIKTNTATQQISEVEPLDSLKKQPASNKEIYQENALKTKETDSISRDKKIIHKHKAPEQDKIDSLKKLKGKNKFKQE